jgi:isoquinoline 1-oxidoreductase subunit beta
MLTVNHERHGVDATMAMATFRTPCRPPGPSVCDLPARSAFSLSMAQEQAGSCSDRSLSRAFDACSFLDQRAAEIGRDPLQFLMSMLTDEEAPDPYLPIGNDWDKTLPHERQVRVRRMRNVLLLAITRSGWRSSLPVRNGRGISLWGNRETYVGVSARVAVGEDGRVSVLRIDLAADCGAVANPESVTTAFKDAALSALDKALSGWRTPEPERIALCRPATIHVHPANNSANIRVHIVRSDAAPGCVSEAAIAPVMAAITNGVFAATGHRPRALPVDPSMLKVNR